MQPARFSRSAPVLTASVAALLLCGCSPSADSPSDASSSSGGAGPSGSGGGSASGGSPGSGGGSGGQPGGATGGNAATGGSTQQGTGGAVSSTGGAASGGTTGATGGAVSASGGAASGGMTGATGGAAMGGRGGSAVGTGGASGGASGTKASAGCGTATAQALNQWVESMVSSGGSNRAYSVRLPTGYNASRAYPVIVLLHGCGGGTNNVPMEKATGTDAILVRGTGSASGTCWTTTANGADVTFFDAMVSDTKARFCADENRFFVVGYSSGSWLANQLTCIRSSVLRGAATVTGGESAGSGCMGPVSRIFIHDKDDSTNVISGSEKARDRQLTQNGCDKAMQPVAQDPAPCVGYPGCPAAYPVVFCATSGEMHNRQDSFAPSTFWNFFKKF